jgi:hypothetical protein
MLLLELTMTAARRHQHPASFMQLTKYLTNLDRCTSVP